MRHFKPSEFACKCGCGKAEMNEDTLFKLDFARHLADIPFVVTSGYRCEAHNRRVGGKSNSAHTRGYAVDIRVNNSAARYAILDALMRAGFNRIGIANTFIHADDDPNLPPNVMWNY
ncbi:MAG TPA: D-Ala-D-Ala carboxypeptidase family metallohydrolase [Orrella sp.]